MLDSEFVSGEFGFSIMSLNNQYTALREAEEEQIMIHKSSEGNQTGYRKPESVQRQRGTHCRYICKQGRNTAINNRKHV